MNTSMNTPQINYDRLKNERWSEEEANNVRVVVNFFQKLFNEHDFDYILETFGKGNYIQHNRAIPEQIPGLIGYVKGLVKRYPEYSFDVKRAIASGDFVVLHSHATFKAKHRGDESKGFIITDTFRLENTRPVEHWDAIQPIDAATRLLFLMIGGQVANENPTF
mgnify:CR=1 FL=1